MFRFWLFEASKLANLADRVCQFGVKRAGAGETQQVDVIANLPILVVAA